MSKVRLSEGATPPTPPSGKIYIYAKADGMYFIDDTGTEYPLGGTDSESKALIIESPTAAEDISFYFTDVPITVTKMRAVLVGSATPSVTWTVRHGTDRAAAGSEVVTGGTVTTSVTTGSDITAFDDATIVADSWLWIETTAQSGTVGSIIITLFYDED